MTSQAQTHARNNCYVHVFRSLLNVTQAGTSVIFMYSDHYSTVMFMYLDHYSMQAGTSVMYLYSDHYSMQARTTVMFMYSNHYSMKAETTAMTNCNKSLKSYIFKPDSDITGLKI